MAAKAQDKRVVKLPNDSIFQRLVTLSTQIRRPVIYDTTGIEVGYQRFFHDLSRLRTLIRDSVPPSLFDEQGIVDEEHPYICLLGADGYDFILSFYTCLAMGAAAVPLASGVLQEEAGYFLEKAKTHILLTPKARITQANNIKEYTREDRGIDINVIVIPESEECPVELEVELDHDLHLSPSRPAVALFTSGTTGWPKAVVLPRRALIWPYDSVNQDGVTMAYRPPHWSGGFRSLIQPLLRGNKVHILPNRPRAGKFWEYFRDIPFTYLNITPQMLRELKEYFEEHLSRLPPNEIESYVRHIRKIKEIGCSGAMIEASNKRFWRDLLGSDAVTTCYAVSELGTVSKTSAASRLKYSIGTPASWVSLKLSEGDSGEALVKGPSMFSGYLNDDEATERALDHEGYFRTGDLLRRVGDEYVFQGRAANDFILFYGYRIPIVELEGSLLDLAYITDAVVIGAPDHEAKELAAAIVRVKEYSEDKEQISLKKIRRDLSTTLATHKLPALLRVLRDDEEIPRTVAGKPIKRGLLTQFFGIQDFVPARYSWANTEYWGNKEEQVLAETRPWDWCGLQRSD